MEGERTRRRYAPLSDGRSERGASKQVSKAKKQLCGVYSTVGGEGRLFCALVKRGGEGGPWSATTVERPPPRPPLFFSLRTSYTDAGTAYGRTSEGKGPNEERCCCFRQRERETPTYITKEGFRSSPRLGRWWLAWSAYQGGTRLRPIVSAVWAASALRKTSPLHLGAKNGHKVGIGARPRRGEGRRRASIINIKEMRGRELGRGLVVGMQRRRRIVIRNAT